MRPAAIRRAVPLVAVCAALLSAGCGPRTAGEEPRAAASGAPGASGSSGASSSPAPTPTVDRTRIVRAALTATGRTSARTAHKTEISQAGGPVYVLTGEGAHDFARHRGRTTAALASAARFEEVFANGKVYLRGSAGDETVGWSVVDRGEVKARNLLRAPANDPEYTLRQAAMAKGFTRAGEEKLRGVATVRYRGLLPQQALTLEMEAERRKKIDQLGEMMGGALPVTADVWVDPQGRAAQLRLSLKIADQMSSVLTLTLSELGRPVKITVPTGATAADAADAVGVI